MPGWLLRSSRRDIGQQLYLPHEDEPMKASQTTYLRTTLVSIALLVAAPLACAEMALNPDVHQDTIDKTICVSGYTKTVRPSTSYSNGVKDKLLRQAGIDLSERPNYELDHIVPLALGGHPRSLNN